MPISKDEFKGAITAFSTIAKSAPVEVDLSKVATAVKKAITEAPVGNPELGLAVIEDKLGQIDDFVKSISYDESTDTLYAPGTDESRPYAADPAMKRARKAQQPANPQTPGSPGFLLEEATNNPQEGLVSEGFSMAAKAEKLTKALHQGFLTLEQVRTLAKAEGLTVSGPEAMDGSDLDVNDYHVAHGAGRAKKPTPKEQAENQYTAASGVADDSDKGTQYTRDRADNRDFTFADQTPGGPNAGNGIKGAKGPTGKAQSDALGGSGPEAEVDTVDSPKPKKPQELSDSEYDGGVTAADNLKAKKAAAAKAAKAKAEEGSDEEEASESDAEAEAEGDKAKKTAKGKPFPGAAKPFGAKDDEEKKKAAKARLDDGNVEGDEQASTQEGKAKAKKGAKADDEIDDRSDAAAKAKKGAAQASAETSGAVDDTDDEDADAEEKAKAKKTKKFADGEAMPEAELSDNVDWAADMSPHHSPVSRAARLTKHERPIPARVGAHGIDQEYSDVRKAAFSNEGFVESKPADRYRRPMTRAEKRKAVRERAMDRASGGGFDEGRTLQ